MGSSSSNNPPSVWRLVSFWLAQWHLPRRSRCSPQDSSMDGGYDNSTSRHVLSSRILDLGHYSAWKTTDGYLRRRNLCGRLGVFAIQNNNHGNSYISKSEAENPFLGIGLMLMSIFGAMQTFAHRTGSRADNRWSRVFPFTVFSFGEIYTVAELYFIIQISGTSVELSILISGIVFLAGLVTMMLTIRKHVGEAGFPTQVSRWERRSFTGAVERNRLTPGLLSTG